MTGPRCVVCFKPFRNGPLCGGCEKAFERTIAEIPALSDELDTTITRQSALGSRNGSRATETPVAFNVRASIVAEELKATLVGWMRDLGPERRSVGGPVCSLCTHDSCGSFIQDMWPADSIASIGRFLLWKLPDIRQHPAVDQMIDEITYACRAAWRAVDRPKDRSKVKVDDCLEVSCLGELYAVFPIEDYDPDDESTHAKMTCSECQVTYAAEMWMHVGKRLLARSA